MEASTAAIIHITLGNDSGPKHLSWGMSLRRPVGVGKLGMSNDSPRCHDTTTTTTTTVLSSFHEVISISSLLQCLVPVKLLICAHLPDLPKPT